MGKTKKFPPRHWTAAGFGRYLFFRRLYRSQKTAAPITQSTTKIRLISCPTFIMTAQPSPKSRPSQRISAVQGSEPKMVSTRNFTRSMRAKPAGREMKVRTTGSIRLKKTVSSLCRALHLKSAVQSGKVYAGRFYWPDNQDPDTCSVVRRGEGEARREPKDIPVQEAVNALCYLLERQFGMPEEDLIRGAARQLGFVRPSDKVSALMDDALEKAMNEGKIVRGENGNLILRDGNG